MSSRRKERLGVQEKWHCHPATCRFPVNSTMANIAEVDEEDQEILKNNEEAKAHIEGFKTEAREDGLATDDDSGEKRCRKPEHPKANTEIDEGVEAAADVRLLVEALKR